MRRHRHSSPVFGIFMALAVLVAPIATAQIQIKVNDDTFFKVGLLVQTQADALQDAGTGGYAQNIFVRRVRLLAGGQIAKNLSFFVETDSPNLGKSLAAGTKNSQPTLYLQDAYVEYKFSNAFALDAGLILASPSRNGLQSAASLLPIDYSPYTFANSGPTQSNVGRDTGLQAKGYLLGNKLEYRAGVFQGARDQQDRELRFTGRLQYNFLDPETSFFYTGTYLGKKKVLAIGAGIDRQDGYTGQAFDVFFDHPVAGGAITSQAGYIEYDGGSFLKTLPKQKDILLEAGYLIGTTRLMPVVQYTRRNFASGSAFDEHRLSGGLNYYLSGHNANIKALFTRIDNDGTRAINQATVQVQFFYF